MGRRTYAGSCGPDAITPIPHRSLRRRHKPQNQRNHRAAMAKIHPRRRDDRWANAWLAKHSPKAEPKPKPKRPPLERWQIRVRMQKQERRALAKPLLKGVE